MEALTFVISMNTEVKVWTLASEMYPFIDCDTIYMNNGFIIKR